jgi:hypothetical protein
VFVGLGDVEVASYQRKQEGIEYVVQKLVEYLIALVQVRLACLSTRQVRRL